MTQFFQSRLVNGVYEQGLLGQVAHFSGWEVGFIGLCHQSGPLVPIPAAERGEVEGGGGAGAEGGRGR